jgi:hypothetical protein
MEGRRRGGAKCEGNEHEHEVQQVENDREQPGGEGEGEEVGVGGDRASAMTSVAEVVGRCVSEVVMRHI